LSDFFWNCDGRSEKLAKLFRHIRSQNEAEIIIQNFTELSIEEQSRFLSWLAGSLTALNNENFK